MLTRRKRHKIKSLVSRLKGKHPNAKILYYDSKKRRGEKPFFCQVLQGAMRRYVIDKIKKPLMKAIVTLAQRYPDPTRENCRQVNSHILFDIRDKFFEYEGNLSRKALFDALFKLFIAEYEHDPYYRYRLDWMLEQVMGSDWQPRKIRNEQFWNEPEGDALVQKTS